MDLSLQPKKDNDYQTISLTYNEIVSIFFQIRMAKLNIGMC